MRFSRLLKNDFKLVPFKVLLLALAVVLVVAGLAYFIAFGGNIYGFFRIGSSLPLSPYVDVPDEVLVEGAGYDGHLFLTIALDPLLLHPGSIAALDNPGYRYRRILFPILGYGFALGRRSAVPYTLVIINIMAFAGIAGILAKISGEYNKPSYIPLLILSVPGLWLSQLLTTADLLGAFLLTAALCAYMKEKPRVVAACYALAALTHETMLIVIGSLIVSSIIAGRRREAKIISTGIIPFALWNLFVRVKTFPEETTSGFIENFGVPGSGILDKIIVFLNLQSPGAEDLFDMSAFVLLLSGFTVLLVYASHKQSRTIILPPALAYSGFFLIARMQILVYYAGFLRVFSNVFLLFVFWCMIHKMPPAIKSFFLLASIISFAIIMRFLVG